MTRPAFPRRTALVSALALAVLASPAGQASPVAQGQAAPAAQGQAASQPRATFRSGLDLVVVNAVVRDKDGKLVRGLTRDDFVVVEDNKPQLVTSFDFEEITNTPAVPEPAQPMLAAVTAPKTAAATAAPLESRPVTDMKDRRLMIFFFDLGSMQDDEVVRAVTSAREYIQKRMVPADLVAVASLSTSLRVDQDFTADRDVLMAALDRLNPVSGYAGNTTTDPEETPDTGNSFIADDSEFNIFNTDRRLDALRAIADAMAGVEQKKSLLYFSGGITQSGMDNQAALRTLIDRAVRANLSIYAADTRGLQALPAGGDASQASVRGTAAFSGRSMDNARSSFSAAQDTLSTLAGDTGGRAFFDANDFTEVFNKVVEDTSAYYLLGYTSTNPARDGRFRRIKVTLKKPGYKIESRAGYYAPRDFAHSGRDDREQQMQEQLLSDLPLTDLPVHGSAGYFRLAANRYFVPLWFIVPGSQVQFSRASDKEKATLDVFGVIRNAQKQPVGWIRDTVKLSVAATEDVRRRNVQYSTNFELPPGYYQLKIVIRENQLGTFGSFESTLVVPNLSRNAVKLSSIVIGTQRQPASQKKSVNPLVRDGQELMANVAHVVSSTQPIHFYYEVYDPGPGRVRVLSNLSFFRGSRRVLQTDLIAAEQLNVSDRKAVAFELVVPPGLLDPGLYTCQVNIIDDTAGTFAFPRLAIYVRK